MAMNLFKSQGMKPCDSTAKAHGGALRTLSMLFCGCIRQDTKILAEFCGDPGIAVEIGNATKGVQRRDARHA